MTDRLYGHGDRLSREDLADWLNRRPPQGSWRDFFELPDERDWPEFEWCRVGRELAEAGHG